MVHFKGHATGALIFGFNMNTTTNDRTNYTLHTSVDGGVTWEWTSGVYPYWSGYSALSVLVSEATVYHDVEAPCTMTFRGIHSDSETERQRERQRDKERDRETERQRHRETESQRHREADMQRDRETERQRDRETD